MRGEIFMTDNEIIKALEWLIFNFPKVEKHENDSDRLCNCINLYCKNAVDELKRQKAEIERLQKSLDNMTDALAKTDDACRQAQSEAIKEFWNNRPERLNEQAEGKEEYNKGWNACLDEFCRIRNLVKEMEGVTDA